MTDTFKSALKGSAAGKASMTGKADDDSWSATSTVDGKTAADATVKGIGYTGIGSIIEADTGFFNEFPLYNGYYGSDNWGPADPIDQNLNFDLEPTYYGIASSGLGTFLDFNSDPGFSATVKSTADGKASSEGSWGDSAMQASAKGKATLKGELDGSAVITAESVILSQSMLDGYTDYTFNGEDIAGFDTNALSIATIESSTDLLPTDDAEGDLQGSADGTTSAKTTYDDGGVTAGTATATADGKVDAKFNGNQGNGEIAAIAGLGDSSEGDGFLPESDEYAMAYSGMILNTFTEARWTSPRRPSSPGKRLRPASIPRP